MKVKFNSEIKARDQHRESAPEVDGYQTEIDLLMEKSGNYENRMHVLTTLMLGRLMQMHTQLKDLRQNLTEICIDHQQERPTGHKEKGE